MKRYKMWEGSNKVRMTKTRKRQRGWGWDSAPKTKRDHSWGDRQVVGMDKGWHKAWGCSVCEQPTNLQGNRRHPLQCEASVLAVQRMQPQLDNVRPNNTKTSTKQLSQWYWCIWDGVQNFAFRPCILSKKKSYAVALALNFMFQYFNAQYSVCSVLNQPAHTLDCKYTVVLHSHLA